MREYIKNFFSKTPSVLKKGTVETLCVVLIPLIVLAVCLIGVSCERYEPSNTSQTTDTIVKVCDVDNPLTDLTWLKEIVDSGQYCKIHQCTYNDTIGFILSVEDGFGRYILVDCEGKRVCFKGDMGGDCWKINIDFESRKLLWINPEVLRVFNDPLNNSKWLRSFVDKYPTPSAETLRIYKCNYRDGIGFLLYYVNSGDYDLVDDIGGGVCYSGYPGDCSRYNIDFESKVLIWEYIND